MGPIMPQRPPLHEISALAIHTLLAGARCLYDLPRAGEGGLLPSLLRSSKIWISPFCLLLGPLAVMLMFRGEDV